MLLRIPGRTELGGNHTDHQGGRILAAAVEVWLTGEVQPLSGQLRLRSEGYPELCIPAGDPLPHPEERGTPAALLRGVAAALAEAGYPADGLSLSVRSEIPIGKGLSSSAALGILIGRAVSALYYGGRIPPLALAKAAQTAENRYFGKPCGLMDQCACAFGGVSAIDFRNASEPVVRTLNSRLFAPDYVLLAADTGAGHEGLTADYAAITGEMFAAAAYFGKQRLCELPEAELRAAIPGLRRALGDRPVLRALHYYEEDARAEAMAQALEAEDLHAYLHLMDASGRSSEALLQNAFSPAAPQQQGIPLALALCRRVLGSEGAARVHGGGFAGTVLALLPAEREAALRAALEPVFGVGCCRSLRIAPAVLPG